jgi:hypothetical protein
MKKFALLTATIIMAFAIAILATGNGQMTIKFGAHLTGDQVVPSVDTEANGQFNGLCMMSDDTMYTKYELNAGNIQHVMAAHIHAGAPGETGDIIATLFTRTNNIDGTKKGFHIMGMLGPTETDAVKEALMNGGAYVNIHTEAFPDGEIRGQLRMMGYMAPRN